MRTLLDEPGLDELGDEVSSLGAATIGGAILLWYALVLLFALSGERLILWS